MRHNFKVIFFLLQISFKGISSVKWKATYIFWWTFIMVRFIFIGISNIKRRANSQFLNLLCLFFFMDIFFFLENIMKKTCVKMNGFLLYCEVFNLSCSFLNEFFYTITWINVARVALRCQVRTLRRGRQPELWRALDGSDGPQKCTWFFFIEIY